MSLNVIGVDFKVKVMDAAGPDGRSKRVKVTIWDTGTWLLFPCVLRFNNHYC